MEGARKLQVPKFLSTNPNLYHNVGETAVLECAVENLGDRKVSCQTVFPSFNIQRHRFEG